MLSFSQEGHEWVFPGGLHAPLEVSRFPVHTHVPQSAGLHQNLGEQSPCTMTLFSPVTVWWLQNRNHINPALPPACMNKRTTVHVSPNGDCCRVLQHDLGWALNGRVCGYKWLYLWVYLVTSVHLIVFVLDGLFLWSAIGNGIIHP